MVCVDATVGDLWPAKDEKCVKYRISTWGQNISDRSVGAVRVPVHPGRATPGFPFCLCTGAGPYALRPPLCRPAAWRGHVTAGGGSPPAEGRQSGAGRLVRGSLVALVRGVRCCGAIITARRIIIRYA